MRRGVFLLLLQVVLCLVGTGPLARGQESGVRSQPAPAPNPVPRPGAPLTAPVGAPTSSVYVVVVAYEGAAEVLRRGATVWDRAATEPPYHLLYLGDRFRTRELSRATLRLPDQSLVRLRELSEIEVLPAPVSDAREEKSRLRAMAFQLWRGMLYFFHRDAPADVRINTRTASSAVRGTEFHLQVDEATGRTELTLIDGEVEMSNPDGTVTLYAGDHGVAEFGRAPTKSPSIEAINIIQWCLYYPAVLDPDELPLTADEAQALGPSLAAYRSGDLNAALAEYPAQREPTFDADRLYRAALVLSVGEVGRAEAQLAALKSYETDARVRRLADALRRMVAAVKLQEFVPPQLNDAVNASASESMALSYEHQARSRLPEALAAARAATQRNPQFGFAWARVAELEFSFGRNKAALKALNESLELSPRNAQALALKGFLLSARAKSRDAMSFFDQAVATDGALANAWLGRGLSRIHRGDRKGGRDDLMVAAALEPQRALLRSYLGKAYGHEGDTNRAYHELGLAKQMDPRDPTPWHYSALLHQRYNRINEAIDDLERAQQLNSNRSIYRSRLLLDQDRAARSANLANIYRDAGLAEVSLREAVRAVSADYANYSAHLFLANTYDQLRDPRLVALRYETPTVAEYLVATLLAPVSAGTIARSLSSHEYSPLFEQNRVGLASTTEYLSNGDWLQSGVQYGAWDTMSYAVEANYRSDNGHRANNELERLNLSLQAKWQLTPQDTLYAQGVYAKTDHGDVTPNYNNAVLHPRFGARDEQSPVLLAGYHHEWSPGSRTLLLAGRLADTLETDDPRGQPGLFEVSTNGAILRRANIPFAPDRIVAQHYRSRFVLYSGEGQQILQAGPHTLILGGRYQRGTVRVDESARSARLGPSLFPPLNRQTRFDLERVTPYGYWQWQPLESLQLTAGVSYDWLTYPENFRFSPLSDGERKTQRLSPKAGVIWTPWEATVVRAAFARSLGGVSFDQSIRLEPTLIGGFNQAFRSAIPDAVTGSSIAERFDVWSVSLEHKFPTRTYVGCSAEWIESDTDRTVGFFGGDTNSNVFRPIGAREKLAYTEQSVAASVHQLVGREWSFAAGYRMARARLEDRFPAVPARAIPSSDSEAWLHQVTLAGVYNHPSGFFAQADALWTLQDNQRDVGGLRHANFWQFNVHAGWRFWQRRAEARASLLNLTDRDYRLNPLNFSPALPRDRTIGASFRIYF